MEKLSHPMKNTSEITDYYYHAFLFAKSERNEHRFFMSNCSKFLTLNYTFYAEKSFHIWREDLISNEYNPRGVAGNGGEWYCRPRRKSPSGSKLDI